VLLRFIQGAMLLGLTVAIHVAALSAMLQIFQKRYHEKPPVGFIAYSCLLTGMAAVTVLAHLFEIALWAAFYTWKEALPDLETSFYFSSVTYSTIGYGDIVLPQPWRLVGAMEGLTGILMCGLSGAFFFAVISRLYALSHTSEPQH